MSRFKEYLERYSRMGRCTPEEAQKQAICREVEKYYEGKDKEAPTLRHEFVCCSES